jgi:hypothetical protein
LQALIVQTKLFSNREKELIKIKSKTTGVYAANKPGACIVAPQCRSNNYLYAFELQEIYQPVCKAGYYRLQVRILFPVNTGIVQR